MLSEPLIQIVLAFIGGIAIGNYLPIFPFSLYLGVIFSFLLSIFLFLLGSARLSASLIGEPKRFALRRKILPYFILFTFLLSGACHLQNSKIISSSDISRSCPGRYDLIGTIIKEPERGKFKSNLVLRAEEIEFQGLAKQALPLHKQNVVAELARRCSKNRKKVTGKVWISTTSSQDSIEPLHYGDRVRIKSANLSQPSPPGNPGEFDFRNWLARQKIYTMVTVKPSDLKKIGAGKMNPLLKYSYFLKEKIEKIIGKIIAGEPEVSIIKAMTLGERDLPYFIKEPFLKTGIFHLLVVSGLHVGFIILFITLFTPFLPLRAKEIFTILAIIFYCLITGARPPVLRASLMAIIYFSGRLFNRESFSYIAIALAAFILLLFDPNQFFAPGFQLSFIVTLGILSLSPLLMEKLPKLPLFLKGLIAVPIAAQLAAFPLIAFHFHYFSLLSPLTNILLIPLAGLNVGLSFLAILFGSFSINLGAIFGATLYLFTSILFKLTKVFAQFPFVYREIGSFSLLHLFCYYYLLILIFNLHRLKRERVKITALVLILLFNLFLWPKALAKMETSDFAITVLKVPDGNCLFLQFPDKKYGLIIGDEDNYRSVERIIKPFLWSQSVGRIDYLLLDEVGDDHLGSLSELSIHFRIKEIIDHPDCASSITYKNFLEKIAILRKKYLLDYRKGEENQPLIESIGGKNPFGYRIESLTAGFYRIRYKNNCLIVGMDAIAKDSYQKLFSLKDKNLKGETLILPHLPRRKMVLVELIKRVQPEKIILTKSPKEESKYLPEGIALFSVQKRGAMSLTFD